MILFRDGDCTFTAPLPGAPQLSQTLHRFSLVVRLPFGSMEAARSVLRGQRCGGDLRFRSNQKDQLVGRPGREPLYPVKGIVVPASMVIAGQTPFDPKAVPSEKPETLVVRIRPDMVVPAVRIPLVGKFQRAPAQKKELDPFLPEGEIRDAHHHVATGPDQAAKPAHDEVGWRGKMFKDFEEKDKIEAPAIKREFGSHDVKNFGPDREGGLESALWNAQRDAKNRRGQGRTEGSHLPPSQVQDRLPARVQIIEHQRQAVPVAPHGLEKVLGPALEPPDLFNLPAEIL